MTPQETLTVAFFQQSIVWESPQDNYQLVADAFRCAMEAKPELKPDILIVPETFNTGFSNYLSVIAENEEGATYEFAHQMARQYDALFVGSWAVRDEGTIYNRMHLVTPSGAYTAYDKHHTFSLSSEGSQVTPGSSQPIAHWRGWNVRPAICYDLRFPIWLRNRRTPDKTSPLTYDLMLLCANWPSSRREAWRTLLAARAIENEAYVIGVNCVGVDGLNIDYEGDSRAVDYAGGVIASCAAGESSVVFATLSYAALERFRRRWPFYLDAD